MTGSQIVRRVRVPLGLVFTIAFVFLARPTWISLAESLLLVLAGLGLRAAAAGTLRKKQSLATSGPYAFTRNPLYLGSALLASGFALASTQWPIFLGFAALFTAVYVPTILGEEQHLRVRYPGFDEYRAAVPRFLPRLTPAHVGGETMWSFSQAVYVKNREYQATMGAAAIYAALIVRIILERKG